MLLKIISHYFVWRGLIFIVAFVTSYLLPQVQEFLPGKEIQRVYPYLLWVWGNFDGIHYMTIAQSGYLDNYQGFFPLYPFIIKVLNYHFNIPFIIGGQIVSTVAFIASVYLITLLLRIDKKINNMLFFWVIIFSFPTSFYYNAVYNDSLYLFLACLCMYLSRIRHFFLASIVGALSVLTRLNGLALMIIILGEYAISKFDLFKIDDQWEPANWYKNFKKLFDFKAILFSGIASVILIPFSLLLYLYFIQLRFGSWYKLMLSMSTWNQERFVLPLQVVWRYIKIVFLHPTFYYNYWIAVAEFSFFVFYILILIYAWKKIRPSYWLFILLSILIPSSTGTLQGMPRYGLHLYPFFLALTMLISKSSAVGRTFYFIISVILLVIFIALFTRGYFVA